MKNNNNLEKKKILIRRVKILDRSKGSSIPEGWSQWLMTAKETKSLKKKKVRMNELYGLRNKKVKEKRAFLVKWKFQFLTADLSKTSQIGKDH